MAKQQRTLEKLARKPAPADIRWEELKAALEHLGYQELPNSGSRRRFVHSTDGHVISLHKPHPQPEVKQYVIRMVAEQLKQLGRI